MTYEAHWEWWLEEACYRVSRGVSLLSNPSEVSREGWHQISTAKAHLESTHDVHIFRGQFITDDLGEAAEVYVAKYPWVERVFNETTEMSDLSGSALMGLLLGYSGAAIGSYLQDKVLAAVDKEVDLGDLLVTTEGVDNPFRHNILGDTRCKQLALYLTDQPTPGYEIWWGQASGGARKLGPGEVYVHPDSLRHLLEMAKEIP